MVLIVVVKITMGFKMRTIYCTLYKLRRLFVLISNKLVLERLFSNYKRTNLINKNMSVQIQMDSF